MLVGFGRDLRRVGDGDDLQIAGEGPETFSDGIRHGSADTGINFVEDQNRG